MISRTVLLFLCTLLSIVYKTSSICNKTPEGVVKPKNRNVGGKYVLEISGNPTTYSPLQRYNISLKTSPRAYPQKAFKNFMITLEPDNGQSGDQALGQLGFEYDTEMLARFSSSCPNTVIDSSTVPKTDIKVHWIAPSTGSGCVIIKATVVESKENWFSEDESLTRRLCEETQQNQNVQPDVLSKCYACDEAKYEVAFEGKWTRNTHPKDFPVDQWNTKFSDIIGASHQPNHSFWRYHDIATEGLKELAENGITKTLESELKNNIEYIRTIIKARGLQYPNITKSTYAVFRVDRKNHLVSLVSKITPSPDWIVGVSDLELCREDGTWEESRTLNLYPWDVGTNNGIGYESSDPSEEWQPIQRLTANNPDDRKSPFYSEEDEEMKPIAKLHFTRQRLYAKTCEQENDEPDCSKTDWLNWTPCSVTCGEGIKVRQRAFMDAETAAQCNLPLREYKDCFKTHCQTDEDKLYKESSESNQNNDINTEKEALCGDEDENCEDPKCPGTFWGPWSSCSVSCGKGTKTRMRMKKQENEEDDSECSTNEEAECEVDCPTEESSNIFGSLGSSSIIVSQGPVGKVIDCKVTKWSPWSTCYLENEAMCGKGTRYKVRKIKIHQSNGGKECPENLMKAQSCFVPCSSSSEVQECIMSRWSKWTPCSSNCGPSAVRIRTRQIIYQPPGVICPERKEKQKCPLPLACADDGQPIFD